MQEPFTRDRIIEALQAMPPNATIDAKRKANRPIVQRLLRRSTTQQISIQ